MSSYNFILALCLVWSAGVSLAKDAPDEQLVVTGTRTVHSLWNSPVPTQTLLIDDEKLQHYRNLAELLARSPGIEIVSGLRGQTVRLDGLDAKYTLVLVDGQRVGGRLGEAFDLKSFALEGVERVEIIRGAGSALYGSDAIGGVINIITRDKVKQRAKIHADTNGQRDALLATGWKGEKSSIAIDIFGNDDKEIKLDGRESSAFSASKKIGAQVSPRLKGEAFDLKARLEKSREELSATEVSGAGAIYKNTNVLDHQALGLEPSFYLPDDSTLRLTLKNDLMEDDYTQRLRRTGVKQKHEITREDITESGVEWIKPFETQILNLGAQHLRESLESDRLDEKSVKRERSALYVQDEITFGDGHWTLIPAVRHDHDSQFKDHTNKKLGFRLSPDEQNAFMISYGEGYRAPSFKELHLRFENRAVGYIVVGNDELKPETSQNVHAQYNFRMKGLWTAGVGAFHNRIKNLIEEELIADGSGDSGLITYSYVNISRAETGGANLDFTSQLGENGRLHVGYNYLYARDLSARTALEGRSKHTLAYGLQYEWSRWVFAHQLKWNSLRKPNADVADDARVKPFLTGDLSATYRQDKHWLYSIAIENIAASSGDLYVRLPRRSLGLSLTWMPET